MNGAVFLKIRNKKAVRGFTLVEIIVVLVILAVLAAAAIPTMLGFVNDARRKSIIPECRVCVVAAQMLCIDEFKAQSNKAPSPEAVKELSDVDGEISNIGMSEAYKLEHLTYTKGDIAVTYCGLFSAGGTCHSAVYSFEDNAEGSDDTPGEENEPEVPENPVEPGTPEEMMSIFQPNWSTFDRNIDSGTLLNDGNDIYVYYGWDNFKPASTTGTLEQYIATNPRNQGGKFLKITPETVIYKAEDREYDAGGGLRWKKNITYGDICYYEGKYYIALGGARYQPDPTTGGNWAEIKP